MPAARVGAGAAGGNTAGSSLGRPRRSEGDCGAAKSEHIAPGHGVPSIWAPNWIVYGTRISAGAGSTAGVNAAGADAAA